MNINMIGLSARSRLSGIVPCPPSLQVSVVSGRAQQLHLVKQRSLTMNSQLRSSPDSLLGTELPRQDTPDLDALLQVLPSSISEQLWNHEYRSELMEIILDLGRLPVARFRSSVETLSDESITRACLDSILAELGEFGPDNRAGIEGTLHRISGIRNRSNDIVGLTCRNGQPVQGPVEMVRDLLHDPSSILILGRPGIGKTTVIRDISRTLADDMHRRVVIVDTSNEIGGDGDVAHPAVGSARRMQVPRDKSQADVMIEAVENHMPEVIVVDEVGTAAEATACRTIAERGVTLIATAHGQYLENLMNNPLLSDLVGGIESVTLGDDTARSRNCQKAVLERRAPSTFPVLIEMRERHIWVEHNSEESVDSLLLGDSPYVKVRQADKRTGSVVCNSQLYSNLAHLEPPPAPSHDGGLSVDGHLLRVSPASAPQVGSASLRATTLNSTPSAVALSYDAAADELNEQYSTSLPASDLDDFSWSGSSGFEEIQAEWLQDMDDVSVLSAMNHSMRPGAAGRCSSSKVRSNDGKVSARDSLVWTFAPQYTIYECSFELHVVQPIGQLQVNKAHPPVEDGATPHGVGSVALQL